jgi:hypothetical protein
MAATDAAEKRYQSQGSKRSFRSRGRRRRKQLPNDADAMDPAILIAFFFTLSLSLVERDSQTHVCVP